MALRRLFTLLGLIAVVATGPSEAQQPLVFTAIPDEDETRLVERFTKCAKYFESRLGVAVKYLPVKSYPAAVTAFRSGRAHSGRIVQPPGARPRAARTPRRVRPEVAETRFRCAGVSYRLCLGTCLGRSEKSRSILPQHLQTKGTFPTARNPPLSNGCGERASKLSETAGLSQRLPEGPWPLP
jgi:hypothetical protein